MIGTRKAIVYVWNNPAIIRHCLRLGGTLAASGTDPVFVVPEAKDLELFAEAGFPCEVLNDVMAGCGPAVAEWLSASGGVRPEDASFEGVPLADCLGYERICLERNFWMPFRCASHDELILKAALCLAAFRTLIARHAPSACFVWNGQVFPPKALAVECGRAGIPVFFLERGLLPGFLVVDPAGINYGGILGGPRWEETGKNVPEPDRGAVDAYLRKFRSEKVSVVRQGAMPDGEEIRRRLGIAPDAKIVFIPNQIDADTNIVHHAPRFPTNESVVRAVAEALTGHPDVFVAVKPHPEDSGADLEEIRRSMKGRGAIVDGVNVHSLVEAAHLVVVRNSTAGLEAVLFGKPVVCLGRASYTGKGLTYDIEDPARLRETIAGLLATADPSLPVPGNLYPFLSFLLDGYHYDLSEGKEADEYNRKFVEGHLRRAVPPAARGSAADPKPPPGPSGSSRIVAILSAYNEGDVIRHVIGDLVSNGIQVYLLDNGSTDDTAAEAKVWLGKGLLKIERFPEESGYPPRCREKYVWKEILKRKEELAAELGADWYIHADADEFRESPWPDMTLAEAIRFADSLGYNAVNFELFNFRPVDDGFPPGTDVRTHILYCERGDAFDRLQVKAWKNTGVPVGLAETGGHDVSFPGRNVFPIPFLLRHYPIRGEAHGRRKVFEQRLPRFVEEERKEGMHVQYAAYEKGEVRFLHDASRLVRYDPDAARAAILGRFSRDLLLTATLQGRDFAGGSPGGLTVSRWAGRILGLPEGVPASELEGARLALAAISESKGSARERLVDHLKAVRPGRVPLVGLLAEMHIARGKLVQPTPYPVTEMESVRKLLQGDAGPEARPAVPQGEEDSTAGPVPPGGGRGVRDAAGHRIAFAGEFYEEDGGWRWMGREGRIAVPAGSLKGASAVRFRLTCVEAECYARFPFAVSVTTPDGAGAEVRFESGHQTATVSLAVGDAGRDAEFLLHSEEVFVPAILGIGADSRFLSVGLSGFEVVRDAARPAPEPKTAASKRSRPRVLVLGVYLADRPNHVDAIVGNLSGSAEVEAVQRWVALGGSPASDVQKSVTSKVLLRKTPKYEILNGLIGEMDLREYEYLLTIDDDILLPENFLDRFIALQARLGFAVAQPARTANSYIDHPIVLRQAGVIARQTRFVEIGPVVGFHESAFDLLLPFDLASPMGWGYENVWSRRLMSQNLKMGIIDLLAVDHSLRRPVENYGWEEADRQRTAYLEKNPHEPLDRCYKVVDVVTGTGGPA